MIKHFLWTLLFFSCNSNSKRKNHFNISSVSDTIASQTTENKSSKLKKVAKTFDNKQPFEIISFTNSIDINTTDTDTSKCNLWTLTKMDIEKIIKNSEPIGGTTWDLSFLVLACTKSVSIIQNGQQHQVEINAGSFFWVNNGDTSALYGDYEKSDRKYFFEGPDTN